MGPCGIAESLFGVLVPRLTYKHIKLGDGQVFTRLETALFDLVWLVCSTVERHLSSGDANVCCYTDFEPGYWHADAFSEPAELDKETMH